VHENTCSTSFYGVKAIILNMNSSMVTEGMTVSGPKPRWLRRRLPHPGQSSTVMAAIKTRGLHTVCEEAHCPNQLECFGSGIATFLLLGPSCTRRCTFCSVDKSPVRKPDPGEPQRTAEAVAQMGLQFSVVTMVTRDDLPDGGAEHVARTIRAIHETCPGVGVEVLISDLRGNWHALEVVLAARPEVVNHNVETVPRLYPRVRPQADYPRSLELLSRASAFTPPVVTKSGLMLGLGEARKEVLNVMDDLRNVDCHALTLGQYLAPSRQHHPVARYIPPEEFAEYKAQAVARGFWGVASAPLVRSSYRAEEMYRTAFARLSARNPDSQTAAT
jgi:lipoic acid synthetase